jgi:hypothetical protein
VETEAADAAVTAEVFAEVFADAQAASEVIEASDAASRRARSASGRIGPMTG